MSLTSGTLTVTSIDVHGNPVYSGTGLAIFFFDGGVTIGGTPGSRTGAGRARQLIEQLDAADAAAAAAPLQPDPNLIHAFIKGPGDAAAAAAGLPVPLPPNATPAQINLDTMVRATACAPNVALVGTYAGNPLAMPPIPPSWPPSLCSPPPGTMDRGIAFGVSPHPGLKQQCLNDAVVADYIRLNAVVEPGTFADPDTGHGINGTGTLT